MGKVVLYGELARRAGTREINVDTTGRTVLEILFSIAEQYNIKDLLFEKGKVRPFYLILIDGKDFLTLGLLNKQIEEEKEIKVIPVFHGGKS